MSERITDERLAEIERYKKSELFYFPYWDELLDGLKAERESLNTCAKANTDLRYRVMGVLGNWRFVEDKLVRQFWAEIISALGDEGGKDDE
jgi:hypothetical protein